MGIRETMPCSTFFRPQGNKWLSDRAAASSQACIGPTDSAQAGAGSMCCLVHSQPTYGTFEEMYLMRLSNTGTTIGTHKQV
ncbi:Serine/threonine protein kinase [Giardia duodenalis assemblage B]|uniref:Serine/threonine protein kinase n=1 Tax=Giardia duodenalis assemblage B TaxID=1394984 RepID=A0A132NRZ6_GIAIN|nr:Serine/threonine protein kinase [Giardia intestinalis assemblage B]